jgi:hypothetical protein
MEPTIGVFVFASPGRDLAHRRCFESLAASDVGQDYTVCMHPSGRTPREHWLETHELAARCGKDWAIVLEDDCLVGEHLLHNCRTWCMPRHRDFGAGWLYNAGGYLGVPTRRWYSGPWEWFGTVAVLYQVSAMQSLVDRAWQRMIEAPSSPWDFAISWAVHANSKKIAVQYPSLVEHQEDVPSVVGNVHGGHVRTSRGTFRADWRRDARDPCWWDGRE